VLPRFAALIVAVVAAAPPAAARWLEPTSAATAVVELVPLSPARIEQCRRAQRLRSACPTRVPRVRAPYLGHLSRSAAFDLFDLERGLPTDGPPRGAHVTVAAGDVDAIAPFRRREWRSVTLTTIGTRRGVMFVAPSYLRGGQLGDHVVFRWKAGNEYLVSLHTWKPLNIARAALAAIVRSCGPAAV
jgi:hypothetical protein